MYKAAHIAVRHSYLLSKCRFAHWLPLDGHRSEWCSAATNLSAWWTLSRRLQWDHIWLFNDENDQLVREQEASTTAAAWQGDSIIFVKIFQMGAQLAVTVNNLCVSGITLPRLMPLPCHLKLTFWTIASVKWVIWFSNLIRIKFMFNVRMRRNFSL